MPQAALGEPEGPIHSAFKDALAPDVVRLA
jgi:hypothetical protein